MTPADAAKILDLPADASPEQLEARFLELRTKLEEKIGKAPTPGLKAKYRESLTEVTTAFETLSLAADSSSLPVAQRQRTEDGGQKTANVGSPLAVPSVASGEGRGGGPGSDPSGLRSQVSGFPTRRKSGGKEFVLVAVIAVVILAAGGWFVMKTRAENAEKARVAAEQKAEAERQAAAAKAEQERIAQATRLEAEEKKKAEEAERLRQEKLTARLRADLAEAKVAWEAIEREERAAERRLSEVKADLRSMRDAPAGKLAEAQALAAAQQDYYTWLSEILARHPARIARGRAEELLAARQADDAGRVMQQLSEALRALEAEIPKQRQALLDLDGELAIQTNPEAAWTLTDAFGRTHRGKGTAQLRDVAVGSAQLTVTAVPWGERRETLQISRSKTATIDAEFRGVALELTSDPAGATVVDQHGRALGVTPLTVPNLPPVTHQFTIRKPEFHPQVIEVAISTKPASRAVKLRAFGTGLAQPAEWRHPARVRSVTNTASAGWSVAAVEEWDFSAPDSKGAWTQIERRILSHQSTGLPNSVRDGSVIHYARQADGKWESRFLKGGVTDPVFANAYRVFAFTPEIFGVAKCWPPDSVVVGDTWPIKATDLPGMDTVSNASGQASGKLLSVDRQGDSDWATLEITFDVEWEYTPGSKLQMAGTHRFRVNLSEGYVADYDTRSRSSGSQTTSTMRITKR